MAYHLSSPAETLLSQYRDSEQNSSSPEKLEIDTLIVGSGYGAAMAALALAENNHEQQERIVVLERGDEYLPEDFPRSVADILPNLGMETRKSVDSDELEIKTPKKNNRLKELWDIRLGKGAITITGSGLGGTSLVNANVVLRPEPHIFNDWPTAHNQQSWHKRLARHYEKIEKLLGVQATPDVKQFAKYRALEHTVERLDKHAKVVPAPVAIDFNNTSKYSIDHDKCNYCGNCVTGCHSGAKQSLNMNAWPLAAQLGVELYTGITVNRLEHDENQAAQPWTIQVRKTSDLSDEVAITAKRVILAAGTLGSSSILYRSRTLSLSKQLGQNFSPNGDTIKFGVGQNKRVNAVANAPEFDSADPPGPTITGVGRLQLSGESSDDKIILEDGAMPFALADFWNEILVTQSMISDYAGTKRSAWHQFNKRHDSLAVSHDLAAHSQVFLTMGRDKGQGQLVPNQPLSADDEFTPDELHDSELLPHWDSTLDDYHERVDNLFANNKTNAFDGGLAQANPTWQLIPPGIASAIQGAGDIPSNIVSVHPIGGCPMGLDANTGVVNCNGQVFRTDVTDKDVDQNNSDKPAPDTLESIQDQVYESLYVLDAAIIPSAIGANPLLTISALAYELAQDISPINAAQADQLPNQIFPTLNSHFKKMPTRTRAPAVRREHTRTEAIFRERLFWDISKDKRSKNDLIKSLQSLLGEDALSNSAQVLILDVSFTFDRNSHGEDTSLESWLQKPNSVLQAKASLRVSNNPLLHTSEDIEVPNEPIATFEGEVNLGNTSEKRTPSNSRIDSVAQKLKHAYQATLAVLRYLKFRWIDLLNWNSSQSLIDGLLGYYRFAKMHARWHYLDYQFQRTDHSESATGSLRLNGQKKLAYTPGGKTLWEALTVLPVEISTDHTRLSADFSVDLIRIVNGPSPLQITSANNTPTAISAVTQLGSYFLRTLLRTHFWSFAALPYNKYRTSAQIDDERLEQPPETVKLINSKNVGIRRCKLETETAKLTQYTVETATEQANNPASLRPAILLTHGLAHGTRLFWTTDTDESYLQFFLKSGFDVWLLDHRASANYRNKVNNEHTVDDIASDVAWAVKHIFNSPTNNKPNPVHVIAHCVGAAATSVAALSGKLQQEDDPSKSMLASFSLHAVTPWLFGSAENRARQNIWWFVDNSGAVKELDSTVHNETSWSHILFDRIAHSMMTNEDRKQWGMLDKLNRKKGLAYTRGVYTRYRFFYGPEFNFGNISKKLKNRFHVNAGKTPINSVKQMFLSVLGERLVNPEAENVYLTETNIRRNWHFPTLFYHGHDNKVFDIESSRLSAFSLTKLRKPNISIDGYAKNDIPTTYYNKHGVHLKTLKNYGHMDMIFGKRATKDIGPHILAFLKAAQKQYEKGDHSQRGHYDTFANELDSHENLANDLPISASIPEKLPSAGPVLSHVSKNSVRVWIESDDYETQKLNQVTITSAQGDVAKKQLQQPDSVAKETGRFWLYELTKPEHITGPVSVSVNYHQDAINVADGNSEKVLQTEAYALTEPPRYTQLDQPKYMPYICSFAAMPWYKREFLQTDQQHNGRLSIALGSCLHPGSTFERDRSDSIFKGIWKHAVGEHTQYKGAAQNGERELDLMLLLGDQIYADATAEIFDSRDYYERYRRRYRSAWTGTWMRRVMSHLPTHFIIDDHEFHDNFSGDLSKADTYNLEKAKQEALNFQLHLAKEELHTPAGNLPQFWHSFNRLGVPFFCFDTRFERQGDKDGSLTSLFGAHLTQWQGFKDWLNQNKQADVLVLTSGSPLCPVRKNTVKYPQLAKELDSLLAYPEFLAQMVEQLHQLSPKTHIIWLAGDPHFSSIATVMLRTGHKCIKLTSITASGLHAAMPFANASLHEYEWGTSQFLDLSSEYDVQIEFNQEILSDSYQQFSKLEFDLNSKLVNIASYGPDGMPLCSTKIIPLDATSES